MTSPLEGLRLQSINGDQPEPETEDDPETFLLSSILDQDHAILPAGAYLVVGQTEALAITDSGALTIEMLTGFLQNGDEGIRLIDADDNIIDAVSYGGVVSSANEGGTATVTDPGAGSIGRCPNGADTNDNAADFALNTTLSPGAPNPCD